jgi:hypothetical protein
VQTQIQKSQLPGGLGIPSLLAESSEGEWDPLPEWASFLMSLGSKVSELAVDDRVVAALSLPTRDFAAPLICAGVVMASSTRPVHEMTPRGYFDYLAALPIGTPLTLREGPRQKAGILQGVDITDGEERLIVQVQSNQSGGLRHLLPVSLCGRVSRADVGKLSRGERGRRILGVTDFLRAVMPSLDPYAFASQSRLDCLMVGNLTSLREEATAKCFAVFGGSGGAPRPGAIQDLIRCRKLNASGRHYRSDARASAADPREHVRSAGTPPVVVFDGASAFLRSRHLFRSSRWIVVLDRSARGTEYAAEAVEQDYMQSRLSDADPFTDLSLPPGVELLGYIARRND